MHPSRKVLRLPLVSLGLPVEGVPVRRRGRKRPLLDGAKLAIAFLLAPDTSSAACRSAERGRSADRLSLSA